MPRKTIKGKAGRGSKKTISTLPFYIVLAVSFIAYLLFQRDFALSILLGALIFFLVIVILALEIMNGFKEEGYTKNIIEIVVAVVLVLAFWFLLRLALNTSYPLDVVPSCSMLPTLQRGDMILLQGVDSKNIAAPVVNVTAAQWNASLVMQSPQTLECVAYSQTGTGVRISQFVYNGYQIGLLRENQLGGEIVPYQSQNSSLIKYMCGVVNVTLSNGTVQEEASTVSVTIGNTTIAGDRNNNIIVYQTVPSDQFYKEGDSYIVHRVYAMINVSGSYYVLTKGDNNPGLDIQYDNIPANISQVDGKVLGSIPYLGYLKLIISNNFVEPTGCNYTTSD